MDPRLLGGFYRGLQAELRMWALGVFPYQNSFSIFSRRTELKDSLQITQDYTGLKPQQFSSTSSGSTAVTDSHWIIQKPPGTGRASETGRSHGLFGFLLVSASAQPLT